MNLKDKETIDALTLVIKDAIDQKFAKFAEDQTAHIVRMGRNKLVPMIVEACETLDARIAKAVSAKFEELQIEADRKKGITRIGKKATPVVKAKPIAKPVVKAKPATKRPAKRLPVVRTTPVVKLK
jgi:hypothetical protein